MDNASIEMARRIPSDVKRQSRLLSQSVSAAVSSAAAAAAAGPSDMNGGSEDANSEF